MASSEGVKNDVGEPKEALIKSQSENEAMSKPKVAAAKSRSGTKHFEVKVSQTLMQDYFSKNA